MSSDDDRISAEDYASMARIQRRLAENLPLPAFRRKLLASSARFAAQAAIRRIQDDPIASDRGTIGDGDLRGEEVCEGL